MRKMLLSIKPEYVEKILSGEKKYEYRKFHCRDDVGKIIIYATAPVQKVIGEAEIADIVEGDPQEVWEKTKEHSGISKEFFCEYYKGKKTAIAYQLKSRKRYDPPLTLQDFGVKTAPQSYCYL